MFDYDIAESSRAVKAMMENFGVSASEAYDYIARGAQNGLDYSGELLDNISEYSVQFKKMGLSASDMFTIFSNGAENGAWNLDKIGDSVKEMAIRVIDGSDTSKQGFEALGFEADSMAEKFAAGGVSGKSGFSGSHSRSCRDERSYRTEHSRHKSHGYHVGGHGRGSNSGAG